MLAIILVAIGSVGAATGLTLYGTEDSIVGGDDLMRTVSIILMIGGTIMTILGGLWFRSNERRLDEDRFPQ